MIKPITPFTGEEIGIQAMSLKDHQRGRIQRGSSLDSLLREAGQGMPRSASLNRSLNFPRSKLTIHRLKGRTWDNSCPLNSGACALRVKSSAILPTFTYLCAYVSVCVCHVDTL